MSDDFFSSLAEFGMQISETLFGTSAESDHGPDRSALINMIVIAAGEATAKIVRDLGVAESIDADDFFHVAAIVADELKVLAEALVDSTLDIDDATVGFTATWQAELNKLQNPARRG